ncbi:MAG: glycosyltransferase family 2 protein [Haloarculaceae archaeon]
MARVSVVVPTYDRPEQLPGAIESALAQTLADVEVVVVDDGSPEPYAADVVADYPDAVRCLRHERNRGLSAARNTGIEHAEGDFVAFLDDDDRWHPTKLDRQVAALEAAPAAGMATCLLAAVSPEGDLLRCEGAKPDGDILDAILVRNVVGSPSRVLVEPTVFDAVGTFDESLPTKQDWDFYVRLCTEYDVVCVDDVLCYRTIHPSMSSSPAAAREDNRRVIDKHESLVRDRGRYERTMAAYYANVGRTYLENDRPTEARRYLRKSLAADFRPWHAAMFLLTFLGAGGSQAVVDAKRTVERWLHCRDVSLPSLES